MRASISLFASLAAVVAVQGAPQTSENALCNVQILQPRFYTNLIAGMPLDIQWQIDAANPLPASSRVSLELLRSRAVVFNVALGGTKPQATILSDAEGQVAIAGQPMSQRYLLPATLKNSENYIFQQYYVVLVRVMADVEEVAGAGNRSTTDPRVLLCQAESERFAVLSAKRAASMGIDQPFPTQATDPGSATNPGAIGSNGVTTVPPTNTHGNEFANFPGGAASTTAGSSAASIAAIAVALLLA